MVFNMVCYSNPVDVFNWELRIFCSNISDSAANRNNEKMVFVVSRSTHLGAVEPINNVKFNREIFKLMKEMSEIFLKIFQIIELYRMMVDNFGTATFRILNVNRKNPFIILNPNATNNDNGGSVFWRKFRVIFRPKIFSNPVAFNIIELFDLNVSQLNHHRFTISAVHGFRNISIIETFFIAKESDCLLKRFAVFILTIINVFEPLIFPINKDTIIFVSRNYKNGTKQLTNIFCMFRKIIIFLFQRQEYPLLLVCTAAIAAKNSHLAIARKHKTRSVIPNVHELVAVGKDNHGIDGLAIFLELPNRHVTSGKAVALIAPNTVTLGSAGGHVLAHFVPFHRNYLLYLCLV